MSVTPALCTRRCALTIAGACVAESGTYAVLFTGSGNVGSNAGRLPSELSSLSQSDGGDVCFAANSDGTGRLNVELAWWDKANYKAEFWVAVYLTAGLDATIYAFYQSNSGTLAQPAASAAYGSQAVWTGVGNLALVQHYGTPSVLSLADSTAHGNNGTDDGAPPIALLGEIGGAADFEVGDYYYVPTSTSMNVVGPITISLWLQTADQDDSSPIYEKWSGDDTDNTYCCWINNAAGTGKLAFGVKSFVGGDFVPASTLAADGVWHLWTFTHNGASNGTKLGTVYVDGALDATAAINPATAGNTADLYVATRQDQGPWWYGGNHLYLDEFRIASVCRSANYVSTDNAIQSSGSLIAVGAPANNGGGGAAGDPFHTIRAAGSWAA